MSSRSAWKPSAPKVTQTTLTVSSVHIGILTGSAGVNDLVLGNPDGYKSPNAISVGKTAVSVAPFSVLSDKIVIKSVEVRAPEITFEGNPFGANNLKKIMDNVNAFTGGAEAKPRRHECARARRRAKAREENWRWMIFSSPARWCISMARPCRCRTSISATLAPARKASRRPT